MSSNSSRRPTKPARHTGAKGRTHAKGKDTSFGEWARRVSGMIKDAPSDLSTRGFGTPIPR